MFFYILKTGLDGKISMADSGSVSKIILERVFICLYKIL